MSDSGLRRVDDGGAKAGLQPGAVPGHAGASKHDHIRPVLSKQGSARVGQPPSKRRRQLICVTDSRACQTPSRACIK